MLLSINDTNLTLHIGSIFRNPPIVEVPFDTIANFSIERVNWKEAEYSGKALRLKLNKKPVYLKFFMYQGKWEASENVFWWILPSMIGVEQNLELLSKKLSDQPKF